MSREVEPLQPLDPPTFRIYTCGPTVYDRAHIGNFRTFVAQDILRRWLKYRGFQVKQVMNLTDVDDKTIRGANQEGVSLREYTDRYIRYFFEDYDALRLERVEVYPRATDHIPQMVELIKRLKERGHAYMSEGSWYFRISSFPEYGKLSKIRIDQMKAGARVDADEYTKEDVRDFVLWKAPKEGEPVWDTPIGSGRPGWHIECSVMSMHYLGETFDLHGGGIDLIFPHHENEIAQSEGATGKLFVKHWFHVEHLIVEGEKMSKSKGNFYTVRQLLDEGIDPCALRFLLLSVHYRKQLNFTRTSLQSAHESVLRFRNIIRRLETEVVLPRDQVDVSESIEHVREDFIQAMDNDLNISEALASLFQGIRTWNTWLNQQKIGKPGARKLLDFLHEIDAILDIGEKEQEKLDEEIQKLIELRQQARRQRDFSRADSIRENLRRRGIILEDTPAGTRWRKATPDELKEILAREFNDSDKEK